MDQIDSSHFILNNFPQLNSLNKKRKEEQKCFIQLNDQLAKYVQTIEYLTIENQKLILLIQILENSFQRKSICIENVYQIEMNQANEILQQIENEISPNVEQTLSDIEQGQFFSEELNQLHQLNQQQIDLIRKTISQNDSVIFSTDFH